MRAWKAPTWKDRMNFQDKCSQSIAVQTIFAWSDWAISAIWDPPNRC